jgi:tRNA A-37 threonylcarbamoyl transferase component Bud32
MTAIGPYDIDRELGRGAFGAVYRAYRRDHPDAPVALKIVEARGDPERLLAEPALLAEVKHPCIVGVEDYFIADGRLAIALEFVNGEDLKAVLDRGDVYPPELVRTLLIQLGGALAAAHARQVVHRDIKPANILVDRTAGGLRFVLTDFGIGRRAEGIQAEKHAGGTYQFMAPEQLRGRPGPQSDLWALGVVAYRLLAGRLPFPGPTLHDLARQIQYESPPPPGQGRGEPIPPDLEAAVMRLLDKSISERTPSAKQLLKELGYNGDSTKVTQASSRPATKRQEPVRRQLERAVTRNRWKLATCVLLYMLPNGVIAGGLVLTGIGLFFAGQSADRNRGRKRVWLLTAASFLVFVLASYWVRAGLWDASLAGVGREDVVVRRLSLMQIWTELAPDGSVLAALLVILAPWIFLAYVILVPVLGCAYYANLRRTQRERALWDAAVESRLDSDRFLGTMRAMVDTRIEDVGFHLRYAELLFARGDHRAAAVEARLLLIQDPYHFNGNLLLANANAALGLWEDCLQVCDEYLAVAGYCFEFGELRQQCLGRLGRS